MTAAMKERGELIRNKLPNLLRELIAKIPHGIPDLKVEGSDGHGSKNRVPWVRLSREANSPDRNLFSCQNFVQQGMIDRRCNRCARLAEFV